MHTHTNNEYSADMSRDTPPKTCVSTQNTCFKTNTIPKNSVLSVLVSSQSVYNNMHCLVFGHLLMYTINKSAGGVVEKLTGLLVVLRSRPFHQFCIALASLLARLAGLEPPVLQDSPAWGLEVFLVSLLERLWDGNVFSLLRSLLFLLFPSSLDSSLTLEG